MSHTRLKMQQNIRTLKQISCVGMIGLCPPSLVKLGPRILENPLVKVSHPLKLHGETC